jgi:hypothetical protein
VFTHVLRIHHIQDEHIHGIIMKSYNLFAAAVVTLVTVVFMMDRCGLNASYGDEPNLFEALWFTLTTLTTVGYGDVVPANWQGKFIVFMMFFYIIAVLPDLINEVSLSREQFGSLGKAYVPEPDTNHVVVIGGNASVEDLEVCHTAVPLQRGPPSTSPFLPNTNQPANTTPDQYAPLSRAFWSTFSPRQTAFGGQCQEW